MSVLSTRALLLFLALFSALSLLHVFDRAQVLEIDLRARAGGNAELFYRVSGEAFKPDRRIPFALAGDGAWHRYRVRLPEHRGIDGIRIDPPGNVGLVELGGISLASGRGTRNIDRRDIPAHVRSVHDAAVRTNVAAYAITPSGDDPFVEIGLPQDRSSLWLVLRRAVLAAVLTLALLPLASAPVRRAVARGRSVVNRVASRVSAAVSDDGVVAVRPSAVIFIGVLMLMSLLYVSLRLHQSSIGVWEWMYPDRPVAQWVDLGVAKRIRSDEWNTQTPWVLNQVQRGWPTQNDSVGGERAPLLAAVPVANPIVLAQPKFLGFALFDLETGFSWWWAYKTFGLVAAFFWLLLVLTRGNTLSSGAGAVLVYASSFTQWWLSSNLPEILIAFAMAVVGASYLLFSHRLRGMVAGVVLSFFAIAGLLLHLYPPFILPLAYLGAALVLGLVLEPGRLQSALSRPVPRLLAIASLVVVTGAFAAVFGAAVGHTVEVMMATVYPGHRIATSGGMPVDRLMYAWFEGFRFGEQTIPANTGNASEASNYVVFAPALLLLFPLARLVERRNVVILLLLAYGLLVGLWICARLPAPVEHAYQVIGWAWSPPARAVVGFGLASILATFVAFARAIEQPESLRRPMIRRWMPAWCAIAALAFGWMLREHDAAFYTWPVVGAGVAAVTLLASALAYRSGIMLAAAVAFASFPGFLVNPLTSGMSGLLDKPILIAARQQGGGPLDRWVVVGDFILSQGLKAHGLDVISGSQLVPNERFSRVLDPRRRWDSVWNRYAHVVYASSPDADEPSFILNQPDLYTVSLSVCGGYLQRMGVNRIAYSVPVPAADLRCLRPLAAPADSGIRLFRLAGPAEAPVAVAR